MANFRINVERERQEHDCPPPTPVKPDIMERPASIACIATGCLLGAAGGPVGMFLGGLIGLAIGEVVADGVDNMTRS